MEAQQDTGSQERPSTARRAMLAGGVAGLAGLAAAAGTGLARPQPASAQTVVPSVIDWINVTNNPNLTYLAAGDGSTDDTQAIQDALNAAGPGQVVYLPGPTLGTSIVGEYLVSAPLVVPTGVILLGDVPVGELANSDAGDGMYGTILLVSSGWSSADSGLTIPGVITFNATSDVAVRNAAVKNLWIDCGSAPSGVTAIASYDNVFHIVIEHVGIFAPTGYGIYGYNNSGARPDGWDVSNVIVERPTGHGVYFEGSDSIFINVHVQNGNAATDPTGDGFYITAGGKFIGCRGDSCQNGFTTASNEGGGDFLSIILVGCSTQANTQNGLNCTNTTMVSGSVNNPVIVTGCSFEGDGVNGGSGSGGYAGIHVEGDNIVTVLNSNVLVDTANASGGCPEYALSTGTKGTSHGGVPQLVQATGGFWNCVSSDLVDDGASMGAAGGLLYDVSGVTGGPVASTTTVNSFHNGIVTTPPSVTTPAVASSGTAVTNTTGLDVTVYISGGTVSVVAVAGVTVLGSSPATVYLPAGATIALTYSSAPSWVWQAV